MKILRQSLRSKLIGVFLVPTLVIVGLYGFLAYFASRQGLEEELGKRLVSIAQTISADMSEGFDAKQVARLDDTKGRVIARLREKLQKARARTGVRRIYLFDAEHKSLVDTDGDVDFGAELYELEPHRTEIEAVFEEQKATTSVLFLGPDGLQYKTGFAPITSDGEVVGALGVEASAEYFKLLTDFASVLTVLAFLAVFLVVLAERFSVGGSSGRSTSWSALPGVSGGESGTSRWRFAPRGTRSRSSPVRSKRCAKTS